MTILLSLLALLPLSLATSAGGGAPLRPVIAPPLAKPSDQEPEAVSIHGTLAVHQRVSLDVRGPFSDEQAEPNPFLDQRMDVEFRHLASGAVRKVPGYFAADGEASESGATAGDVWRAHLSPDLPGRWDWTVRWRSGPSVAVSLDPSAGTPTPWDGLSGWFEVTPATESASPLREQGRLVMSGEHHLQHAASGGAWLQMGANSPENLLAYADFDQTPTSHHYAPHLGDWEPGDPAWVGGTRGRGLIGALNYLADQGMNAVYMLTFNVGGDGDDVWPWTAKDERLRFDVSKLGQWEVVFEHMDDRGLSMNLVLQEQEIDDGPLALDGGELGVERKLYHRELVARFGHHLGLVLNLGEENQNTTSQQVAFYDHLRALDAYQHPIAVHTFPTTIPVVYPKLLDAGVLEIASLQVLEPEDVHATSLDVRGWAEEAGIPWAVQIDEIGPPQHGVPPDAIDPTHDLHRVHVLWGHLMAGGGGCQWYFGYGWPDDDLDCEDWRSREVMWQQSAHALAFFDTLAFAEMEPADERVAEGSAWVLAEGDSRWAAYLPQGGQASLDLGPLQATYAYGWFDPRSGAWLPGAGAVTLAEGQPLTLEAPGPGDWAARIGRQGVAPQVTTFSATPHPFVSGQTLKLTLDVEDADDDVQSVVLSVTTPLGQPAGSLPLNQAADGSWSFAVPNLTLPLTGRWRLRATVTDSMGHTDQAELELLVSPVLIGGDA